MSAKVHNFPRDLSTASLPIDEKHRGVFGLLRVCVTFLTGSFLELDDNVINGLAQRQINEHTNVALVAALIMTITFSFIPGLWGAICSFGFCVTLLLFYHQLRDMEWWFLAIVIVSYVPAMIVLPYASVTYVKHIHAVRINAGEKITVILNSEQVKEAFDRFIGDMYDGNLDAVPFYGQEFDDFMRYVLKKHNGRFIGRTTVVLMKKYFHDKLGVVEE